MFVYELRGCGFTSHCSHLRLALQNRKRKFTKPTVNPDKKNIKPFETDESNVAVAAPEFLIVDSDHDEDEDMTLYN